MLLNQIEVPQRGRLEDWSTGLWGSWGVEPLVGGYPFALVRDNGTQLDRAPWRGNAVNAGFLTAFGASVAVELLNHNNSVDRTLSNGFSTGLPLAVSSSAYLGLLQFDGSNDLVSSAVNFGGGSGATVFFRGRLRSASTGIIFEHSTNYNSNDAFAVYYDSSISRLLVGSHQVSGSRYAISEFNVTITTEAVFCARIDRSQTTGAAQCVLFVNGTKQTRTGATGETSPVPSSNLASGPINAGCRYGTSNPSTLNLKWLAIYDTALSDGDCATISGLL